MAQTPFVHAIAVLIKISETKGTGSRKRIIKLLQEHDSEYFRYVLRVAYDPTIKTKIKTIEVNEDRAVDTDLTLGMLIDGLERQKAISDQWRDKVDRLIQSLPVNKWMDDFEDEDTGEIVSLERCENRIREYAAKIITKTLNIGIDAKIINEAYGMQLIPDLSLMLAKDDIDKVKWGEDIITAELKYDGGRIASIMEDGDIRFITRNFNDMDAECLGNIRDQLKAMFKGHNGWFLDGEIIANDRQSVNGKIGSIIKGKGKPYMDGDWTYVIFDREMNKVLFDGLVSASTQHGRRDDLLQAFNLADSLRINHPNVKLSQSWEIHDQQQLDELFQQQLEAGEEGLIVKHAHAPYVCERSNHWIKMKAEKECELRIHSFYPGKSGTKRAQYIGGFCCVSEDEALEVNVGGGYSDQLLQEINDNNPNSYMGKIITVRYNAVIDNKENDIKSLFLPRFIEFRHDKTQANLLKEIK